MITEKEFDEQSKKYDEDMEEINTLFLTLLGLTLYDVISNNKELSIEEITILANADNIKLNKLIKEKSKTISKEISKTLTVTAQNEYNSVRTALKGTSNTLLPHDKTPLKKAVNSVIKDVTKNIDNLSNTSMLGCFYQPNSVTPKVFLPNRDVYIRVVDNAITSIKNGVDPYAQLRYSLKQIGQNGMYQVYYDNEGKKPYRLNIESAMRRNIMDGMRDVGQQAQDEVGKQIGSDGVEISAHRFPAKDHAKWQGRQMTEEKFDKIQSKLDRPFGKWNCKHYMFRILLGINEQTYSNEELDRMNEVNEKGITDDSGIFGKKGKHYTVYEASQELRKIENATRGLKKENLILKTAGDEVGRKQVTQLLTAKRKQYKQALKVLEPLGFQDDRGRFIIKN